MKSLLALVMTLTPNLLMAGGNVGNGGDVVLCSTSTASSYHGTLSLDYMLTLQNGQENGIVPVSSFEDSMNRISQIMKDRCLENWTPKGAGFSASLKRFLDARENHTNWSMPYIWNASAYGLVDLQDERMSRLLPTNCQTSGKPNIIQAIIRKRRNDMNITVFEYDPSVDAELSKNPLQQSFLYMHEFLRDYLVDADQIRWLNWMLHSESMTTLNDQDFKTSINRLMGTAFCVK